jgi:hypothetical protein
MSGKSRIHNPCNADSTAEQESYNTVTMDSGLAHSRARE